MRGTIKIAFVALALGAGALTIPQAMADSVTVQVNPGGIAFGYTDGYWDRGHQWHAWRDQHEATEWRAANREHYYERKHEAEREQGWRDSDRWWDRH